MNIAMRSVGVRELKDGLSRHLALVRGGVELLVTDHGHPVARVMPIQGRTSQERLAELIAGGDLTPARRRIRSVPRPVRLPGGATVSDLVKEQRR